MSNLTPSAQRLVRAGRSAARPSAADHERIAGALRAQLGDAALPAGSGISASGPRASWLKVSALTVGVGLLAGSLIFALRPARHAPPAVPPAAPPSATLPRASAPLEAAPVDPGSAPAASPSAAASTDSAVEPAATAARRSPDRLAEEVALLSRAASALRAGRANDALKTLDEHQRKFPNGILAEERRAARAQALCTLGRRSEAEVELARLARTAPQSPQAARARQVCDGAR